MKSNFFQVFIIGLFILFAGLGVLVFSGAIKIPGSGADNITGQVIVWGTFQRDAIQNYIDELNQQNKTFKIIYIQRNKDTFDQDLVEAIASGTGPDLIFFSEDSLAKQGNKLYPIPYATIPAETFINTYILESSLFLSQDGVLALPLFVDPLVLYSNRDMLTAAGLTTPPTYWDDLTNTYVPALTQKDTDDTLHQSAIALGEFDNVTNAKAILSTLFLQLGYPIVGQKTDTTNGKASVTTFVAGLDIGGIASPSTALQFYTDFANPAKTNYTWNKVLPSSQDAFTSENLATYIGFASELSSIRAKNPRLNFTISQIPQLRISGAKVVTFGKLYGLAALKSSKNLTGALFVQSQMTNRTAAARLSNITGLTPVRNDLLTTVPTDAFLPVIYRSAIIARSFFDPNPKQTDAIFQSMVSAVTSGRLSATDAVSKANKSLQDILK